jgi:hypothetical protein
MIFHQFFGAAQHSGRHGRRVSVAEFRFDLSQSGGGFAHFAGERITVIDALIIFRGLRQVAVSLEAFGIKQVGLGLRNAVEIFADQVKGLFGLVAFQIGGDSENCCVADQR